MNELYINSYELQTIRWEDLAVGGSNAMTWSEAEAYRWDGLHRLKIEGDVILQAWDDLSQIRWEELAQKTWDDLNYRPDTSGGNVYISYEWKDL